MTNIYANMYKAFENSAAADYLAAQAYSPNPDDRQPVDSTSDPADKNTGFGLILLESYAGRGVENAARRARDAAADLGRYGGDARANSVNDAQRARERAAEARSETRRRAGKTGGARAYGADARNAGGAGKSAKSGAYRSATGGCGSEKSGSAAANARGAMPGQTGATGGPNGNSGEPGSYFPEAAQIDIIYDETGLKNPSEINVKIYDVSGLTDDAHTVFNHESDDDLTDKTDIYANGIDVLNVVQSAVGEADMSGADLNAVNATAEDGAHRATGDAYGATARFANAGFSENGIKNDDYRTAVDFLRMISGYTGERANLKVAYNDGPIGKNSDGKDGVKDLLDGLLFETKANAENDAARVSAGDSAGYAVYSDYRNDVINAKSLNGFLGEYGIVADEFENESGYAVLDAEDVGEAPGLNSKAGAAAGAATYNAVDGVEASAAKDGGLSGVAPGSASGDTADGGEGSAGNAYTGAQTAVYGDATQGNVASGANGGSGGGVNGAAAQFLRGAVAETAQGFYDALSHEAKLAIDGGKYEFTMQMKPENLGRVTMLIASEHGAVNARLIVENEQARANLETNLTQLKQSMIEQGLSVRECSVEVRRDDGGTAGGDGVNDYRRRYRQAGSANSGGIEVSASLDAGMRAFLRNQYYDEQSVVHFTA